MRQWMHLLSWGLVALLGADAWGRAELRLGGPNGLSWQEVIGQRASYVTVDREGNILDTVPLALIDEQVSVKFGTAGTDTLLNYANNALQAAWIDSSENLANTIGNRNGHFYTASIYGHTHLVTDSLPLQLLIDGDPNTAMIVQVPEPPQVTGVNRAGVIKNNVINLGHDMPINRIRFFPRPGFEDNYLAWYEIGVADHTAPFWNDNFDRTERGKRWYMVIDAALNSSNDPAFDILKRDQENFDVVVDLQFPTRDIKWVAIRPLDPERDWELAEFEIYGSGYVTRTTYRTAILDFDDPVAWSKIRWQGDVPEGTQLFLRTRTGNTPQPHIYRILGASGALQLSTLDEYENQLQLRRWDDISLDYDNENWSQWSAPYEFSAGLRDSTLETGSWDDGTLVLSPSPARYFQLEVVMLANRDVTPRLDAVELLFSESPVAQEVIGEIWPNQTGSFEAETFTYVVNPLLRDDEHGFDRLEIFTQIPAESVRSVLVDGEEMLERFPPEILDDRLVVGFERLQGLADNEKRIEVIFDVKVLRFGAEFTGSVFDSAEPELKQQIQPGNASFRFSGDALSVRTPMGGDLISSFQAVPATFTPNGDGVNDRVNIQYELRDLETPRQITFKIYDLAGRLVRQVVSADTRSGSFAHEWNGTDEGGELVPPGTYLYQLDLQTDKGNEVATGTLSVAY